MSRRWRVDPGVKDMIEYLDDPKRKYRWDALSGMELAAIEREIKRCRESFEYAARNYFWITDKSRRDVNFSLWEAQELILERIQELRKRNKAQKLMILKARQLGCCLAPETRVLASDLSWVPIGDIRPGDRVVSGDEGGGVAVVEAVRRITDWSVRIVLKDGGRLNATFDHRFLVKDALTGEVGWKKVAELEPGMMFRRVVHDPGWVPIDKLYLTGTSEMVDLQTSSGTFIAEGYVSHNSTLIEALIAHRVLFFRNIEALVVSVDKRHAAYLFQIMLHIVDRLPWWLQPMVAARKYEEGLWLANPDPEARRDFPGLNSRVVVQASNQISGIGQGRRLNACHISEGADWDQNIHRMTMEGDLQYALADNVETFAVWESTAKGAGTYTEQLWLTNVRLGEKAEWDTLFLPWFFEKTRVMPPEKGWKPDAPELAMRERVQDDWVVCSNKECGKIVENHPYKGVTRKGQKCDACKSGVLEPYVLSDEQLRWMWGQRLNKESKGEDSLKSLKEELCSTPQEAFQIHGIQVFGPECQEFVNSTIRSPMMVGYMDERGNFHGINPETGKCFQSWCDIDHTYDDHSVEIWKLPKPGERYVIGVDVAEGLGGRADYSVAFVNRIGDVGSCDEQVAMFRSNTVDPIQLAYICCGLGYWYNTAMLSIEYNGIGASCADTVRLRLLYPNLYRWIRPDNERPESQSWHWLTNYRTRPKLWQFARRALRARWWIVRSEQFYEEMLRFQKDSYDDVYASSESGWHDDTIMAGMIALYTSHALDTEQESLRPTNREYVSVVENDPDAWRMTCQRCDHKWSSRDPDVRCPKCNSVYTSGTRAGLEPSRMPVNLEEMEMEYEKESSGYGVEIFA